MNTLKLCTALGAAFFCAALLFPSAAAAQRRDYLTEAEIELVRDAQEIDLRVAVLTKAVDRRIAVLNNQTPKEKEVWGPLPKGTRTELLLDIEKLLAKAIDDVDNVAERSRDSLLFPKAVFKLSDACEGYLPQFRTFLDAAADEKERGAMLGALDGCNNVIEAARTLPKEKPKEKKKN